MPLGLVIIYGLLAAFSWGIGDFNGGVSTKSNNVLLVLILSQLVGTLTLSFFIVFSEEALLIKDIIWGVFAGFAGGIGLVALYHGLANGQMGIVAPLSAVFSAGIPVVFSFIVIGLPNISNLFGLIAALIAIWLLSQSSTEWKEKSVSHSLLNPNIFFGIFSGFGFGFFFVFISRIESQSIYWPLTVLRISSMTLMLLLLLISKIRGNELQFNNINLKNFKFIAFAGLGDLFGNIFFTLASKKGRLDIAAVISSLYPLTTVILASLIYHEKIKKIQWIAIVIALFSVTLFTI